MFQMLSTLGFDRKNTKRTDSRNPAKYVCEMPRAIAHALSGGVDPPSRPVLSKIHPNRNVNQNASLSNARQETDRKPLPPGVRSYQLSVYAPPFEPKNSSSKSFKIIPTGHPDTFIYEASLASASDLLSSPASSSSSDSDLNGDIGASLLEVSSTRASSSTETLETTLAIEQVSGHTSVSSTYALQRQRPYRDSRDPVGSLSEDDSDTLQSDDDTSSRPYVPRSYAPASGIGASLPLSTPVRRNTPPERFSQNGPPESVPQTSTRPPLHPKRTDSSILTYDENTPREPPGLSRATSIRQGSPENCVLGSVIDITSKRTVRWKEESQLASDLPIRSQRRGWFNRRGDQLWTNDGRFKKPLEGQEYPTDLSHYPEPESGWMNENGVRIDMHHRLVVTPPRRSCLKRPKQSQDRH